MTNAEWEIMRVIWRYERCTSKMIYDVLKKPLQWSESTVKTLLSRLVKKGVSRTIKKENNLFITRVNNSTTY